MLGAAITEGLLVFGVIGDVIQGVLGGAFHGRPFRTKRGIRLPATTHGTAWRDPDRTLPAELETLSPEAREAHALAWRRDALAEHASIAAFSRLSLELMAVGAPPELLSGCHRAAQDEVRHAQACFSLASAYAGLDLTAGTFPAAVEPRPWPRTRADQLARLAVESLRDGCLNEGLAAAEAGAALELATDEVVRDVLSMVAADEARHAELAWEILAWSLREGGEPVAQAVVRAISLLPRSAGTATDVRLPASARRAVFEAVRAIVQRRASQLLGVAGARAAA